MSIELKSVSGVLKGVEIGALAAGVASVGYFLEEIIDSEDNRNTYDTGGYGRFEFFLYACCVGIIIAICGAVMLGQGFLTSRPLSMAAIYAPATLQLLVSTALLAKVLAEFEEEEDFISRISLKKISMCKFLDEIDTNYQCSQIIGGVICGFLGTALFAADTLISFVSYRRS